jgi:hypothetical protein
MSPRATRSSSPGTMTAPSPSAVSRRSPPVRPGSGPRSGRQGEPEAGRETAAGDLSPVYASAEDMLADLHQRA